MVEFSDSTRRLIIFVVIVFGGSVLLLFDVPVLYLMMAVLFIAVGILVITGTLILSETIRTLLSWFKARPKKEKKPKPKKEKAKPKGQSAISGLLKKVKLPSLPKISMPKREPKPKKEKTKPEKKAKQEQSENLDELDDDINDNSTTDGQSTSTSASDEELDIDLDGLDLDESLDIDAELDSVNPEFDKIRTPFGEENALDALPTEDQVKKMDISTKDEEDDIVLDNDDDMSNDLDDIYSSTLDVGSDGGGDIISSMEGGDSISSSDLASYSSSDETPYDYGSDEGESEQEQFEVTPGKGGGLLGDDDLIASLKADIEDLKKKDDDVLLRDLKDIHVTAEELNNELNQIIEIIMQRAKKK